MRGFLVQEHQGGTHSSSLRSSRAQQVQGPIDACTSGGVYVPGIYSHMPSET